LTAKDLALVPVRMSLGATMLHHGASKLRGDGATQAGAFFEEIGLKPGRTLAQLTGLAEVVAGATSILGLGTRIGALAVIATQAAAIAKVHAGKGFDNAAGGWEFNALLIAAAAGLLVAGPGGASVHELLERRLQGGVRWLFEPRRRAGVQLVKLLR
jgi:putative oxidoreductase